MGDFVIPRELIDMVLRIFALLAGFSAVLAECPSKGGQMCNPHHPFAKLMHADPCFSAGGKHRCLGAAGSFQTMECDCSVPDCGCSDGPALTSCSSSIPK